MSTVKKIFFNFNKLVFSIYLFGLMISIYSYFTFSITQDLNYLLFSTLTVLIINLLVTFVNFRKLYLFLFFNVVVFVFIVSRVFIDFIKLGNDWQLRFNSKNLTFTLSLVLFSLFFMGIAAVISSFFIKKSESIVTNKKDEIRQYIQDLSLILFYISVGFSFMVEIERFIGTRNITYIEYIQTFKSALPQIIQEFGSTTLYFLCIFLSTFPSKRKAILPLIINVILKIPILLAGVRNPIVLSILFLVIYYLMMHFKDNKKWIGRLERRIFILFTPLGIMLLGAMNYLRSGTKVRLNIFELIVDFFYKQGVTFDIINYSLNVLNYLPNKEEKIYTFGLINDYIKYGIIGRILWNTQGLGPAGNTVLMGTKSSLLAHNLSYILYGSFYLEGHGVGSSYLLETYIDWGYMGVIAFSIILGFILVLFANKVYRGGLITIIILMAISKLFFIPRAGALEWIDFLLIVRFWFIVGFVYITSFMIMFIKNYFKKEKFNV